jgi:hypothetical protein
MIDIPSDFLIGADLPTKVIRNQFILNAWHKKKKSIGQDECDSPTFSLLLFF